MEEIKTMAPNYYQNLFNHDGYWNLFSRVVVKRRLTPQGQQWLTREVIDMEIKKQRFRCILIKALVQMALMQHLIKGAEIVLVQMW